ncbi:MAG: hypothetical protein ACQEXG_17165 [Pseudomonadota bacterium]
MIDVQGVDQKRKLVIAVAVFLVVLISWSGIIDILSKEYVNASTVQAFSAYAAARVLNAAISIAASFNIDAELSFGAGVGAGIQPLQILDPLNDLIEQYSLAMKFSISSLVIQKILVEAASTLIFKLFLTFLAIILVASLYVRDGAYSFFLLRFFAFFAMIRFLFVLSLLMNGIVSQAFIDDNISQDMQEVSEVANQVENQRAESGAGLSEDEREGLLAMQDELELEKARLLDSLKESEIQLQVVEEEVEVAQAAVSEFEEAMGTMEKLNVFSREEDYEAALQAEEESQDLLDRKREEISKINEQLSDIESNLENTVALLEGRPIEQSWMASASSKIAEFRDMARWERIKTTIEGVVSAILNLLAAFLFKTLIMPLIFLALFLKGFKYIWGVDPRKWIKDEYSKMKKED